MRRAGMVVTGVVVALALTSCVGIGAVNRGGVTVEAQRRGGGVTGALVEDALDAVAAEAGVDPLPVETLTAELAQVVVVVGPEEARPREAYRYGTSGLYGGRGVERTDTPGGVELDPFPADEVDAAGVDAALAAARAGRPGWWVDSLVVARPAPGQPPLVTVTLTDGAREESVTATTEGRLVEVPR